MSVAIMFPGQGSQSVGMGTKLADEFSEAREVFKEVDDALGQNLFKIISEGPEDQLTLTENAQPALMAVSLALIRVMESQFGIDLASKFSFAVGHSLGEYSALAAARALSLSDTARLLKTRGTAMQQSVPVGQGGMAAILGLDLEEAQGLAQAAAEGEVCTAANDNAPGQVVLSGHATAISRAVNKASEFGARRAVALQVSAPFHCSLMQPAAEKMNEVLSSTEIAAPCIPVLSNITVEPTQEPALIKSLLVQQVTGMVRWRETVLKLRELGVHKLIEVGAGSVLSGLAKRIDRELESTAINDPEGLKILSENLANN